MISTVTARLNHLADHIQATSKPFRYNSDNCVIGHCNDLFGASPRLALNLAEDNYQDLCFDWPWELRQLCHSNQTEAKAWIARALRYLGANGKVNWRATAPEGTEVTTTQDYYAAQMQASIDRYAVIVAQMHALRFPDAPTLTCGTVTLPSPDAIVIQASTAMPSIEEVRAVADEIPDDVAPVVNKELSRIAAVVGTISAVLLAAIVVL